MIFGLEENTLVITVPKDYDFSHKLEAITTPGEYAWHTTKNKPKRPYKYVRVIHNGESYLCERIDVEEGIGFHNLIEQTKAHWKGFQGFRYEWQNVKGKKDELT